MTRNNEILYEILKIRFENKEQFEMLLEEICIIGHIERPELVIDKRKLLDDLSNLKDYCFEELLDIGSRRHGELIGSIERIKTKIKLGEYNLLQSPRTPKITKKECRTCKWVNPNPPDQDYRCSRYPPKRGLFDTQILPRVYPDGLCGEWCEQ